MQVSSWDNDFIEWTKPLQHFDSYLLLNAFDIYLCVGGTHKIDVEARQILPMNATNHWSQSFVN